MAIWSDYRGKPGDLVLGRGTGRIDVFQSVPQPGIDTPRPNTVLPDKLGIIIATHVTAWTYVLWSESGLLGWVHDGQLRPLKTK